MASFDDEMEVLKRSFDDEMAELLSSPPANSSSTAPPPHITNHDLGSASSMLSSLEEFLDLSGLDAILEKESKASASENYNSPFGTMGDVHSDDGDEGIALEGADFDFLSWLEDSSKGAGELPSSGDGKGGASSATASSDSTTTLNTSIDSFFDELYSSVVAKPATPTKALPVKRPHDLAANALKPRLLMDNYEAQLEAFVLSGSNDLKQLRRLLMDGGYVPAKLREKLWLLLLTGQRSSSSLSFASTEEPSRRLDDSFNGDILVDCDAVIAKYEASSASLAVRRSELRELMHDVLSSVCRNNEIEYSHLHCTLLTPLLADSYICSPASTRACFYHLASRFSPFVCLQESAMEVAFDTVHAWLRLLLTYHNPGLAQHLDRVLPGWEHSTSAFSPADSFQYVSASKKLAALDELERQLGLPGEDAAAAAAVSGGAISSAQAGVHVGCVPPHWVCGFFVGSIPPEQGLRVLDWALAMNERLLGVYMLVALLEVYSSALMNMNGTAAKGWLDSVASGQADWFRLLPFSRHSGVYSVVRSGASGGDSSLCCWMEFVCGWLHAATKVRRTTPSAFQSALQSTQEWARLSIRGRQAAKSAPAEHKGSSSSNVPIVDDFSSTDGGGAEFDLDEMQAAQQQQQTEPLGADLIVKLKLVASTLQLPPHLRGGLFADDTRSAQVAAAAGPEWPQDSKTESSTTVLWADASDVVPCLCSSRYVPPPPNENDLISHFDMGITLSASTDGSQRGGEGMCFPLPEERSLQPFYFGLDCRSEAEKAVGRFPKAFAIDPASISDSDCISRLLSTLEPLLENQCFHFCIIGPGEQYLRAQHARAGAVALERELADSHARLSAVSMFFLKRGFRHVSILDGGFMAAVRFLQGHDANAGLSQALIDADQELIDRVLAGRPLEANGIANVANNINMGVQTIVGGLSVASASASASVASVGSFFSQTLAGAAKSKEGTAAAVAAPPALQPKQLMSDLGRKMSVFGMSSLDALKKIGSAAGAAATGADSSAAASSGGGGSAAQAKRQPSFTIDEDDEDGGRSGKTEDEKAEALVMHQLAGLRRGDKLTISRESLPGAVLFPSVIYATDATGAPLADGTASHRFLACTRERFLVMDSGGGGAGSQATVESNHHLTELLKMTFRKRDPELITLFFVGAVAQGEEETGGGTTLLCRVTESRAFVSALQRRMERFKN